MRRIFAILSKMLCVSGSPEATAFPESWNSTMNQLQSVGGDAGAWMVSWVQRQLDTRISRQGHSATSCWDLVMAAIEAANSNGFNLPTGQMGNHGEIQGKDGWVWSDQPISWDQAQPGDVAQFAYWYEYYSHDGGYSTKSTGDVHSALVVSVDGPKLNVYEQNPSKAHAGTYHPSGSHRGVLQVFRVGGGGGSSPSPTPSPSPSPSPAPSSSCTNYPSWVNQDGDTCGTYKHYNYCTASGAEGSGWDSSQWGKIEDWYDSHGNTALVACCVCGGGSAAVVV